MQEEQKTQVIGTRLTNEVIEKIKSTIGDDSMADFIRKAIENELHGSHNSAKEFSGMMKKVEGLETASILEKLINLEITVQILFEELIKQTEMLKVIYRRTVVGAEVAKRILTEQKGVDVTKAEQDRVVKIAQDELVKLNLKGVN